MTKSFTCGKVRATCAVQAANCAALLWSAVKSRAFFAEREKTIRMPPAYWIQLEISSWPGITFGCAGADVIDARFSESPSWLNVVKNAAGSAVRARSSLTPKVIRARRDLAASAAPRTYA